MSDYITKRHNKNLILYHLVCPAKYRRKIFTKEVEETLIEVCKEIGERYEIYTVEIGADTDHVHFLVQSVPVLSPTKIVQTVKSITAREIYMRHPEVKKLLWGGHIWTAGYYVNTVGVTGNEKVIQSYIESQGQQHKQIYRKQLILQFDLFDTSELAPG
jgi:REP element-mobilizing transposase RayT